MLYERGGEYGNFAKVATRVTECAKALGLAEMAETRPDASVAAYMILVKLARLAHKPNHRDSWVDIEGYARLMSSALPPPVSA